MCMASSQRRMISADLSHSVRGFSFQHCFGKLRVPVRMSFVREVEILAFGLNDPSSALLSWEGSLRGTSVFAALRFLVHGPPLCTAGQQDQSSTILCEAVFGVAPLHLSCPPLCFAGSGCPS